jgi:hypothetical protein
MARIPAIDQGIYPTLIQISMFRQGDEYVLCPGCLLAKA